MKTKDPRRCRSLPTSSNHKIIISSKSIISLLWDWSLWIHINNHAKGQGKKHWLTVSWRRSRLNCQEGKGAESPSKHINLNCRCLILYHCRQRRPQRRTCLRLRPNQSHQMGHFVAPFEHFNWTICPPHQRLKSRCPPKSRSLPILSTSSQRKSCLNRQKGKGAESPSKNVNWNRWHLLLYRCCWRRHPCRTCLQLRPSRSHRMGHFVALFKHFTWMICPPHQHPRKARSLPILLTSATVRKLWPNASSMLPTLSPSQRIRNRNLPFFLISTSQTIFVLLSVSWSVRSEDLLRRLSNRFLIETINLSKAF